MPLSTHIDGLSILELLRVISNSRLSGVLTVVDRLRSGRIVFTWGRVTHASVDGQERLGDHLVRRGILAEKDLEAALRSQRGQKKTRPLGTILSSLGYAETSSVQSALREQMKDAFYELLEWKDCLAHLQVDIGTALASVRLDVSLDTQALLLEAARCRDENVGAQAGFNPPLTEKVDGPPEPATAPPTQEETIFDQWEVLTPPTHEEGTGTRGPDEKTPPVPA